MEAKARLTNASRSLKGDLLLTFEVKAPQEEVDKLLNMDLRLTAVKWREKRSLDANSYFHTIAQKMADALNTSLTEVKNQMIIDYGQFEYDKDGKIAYGIFPDGYDYLRDEANHYMPTQKTAMLDNRVLHRIYLKKRGSHTYDTKEMSILIDGLVSEAKELGIETLTPEQLERMKASWKAS